MTTFLRSSTNFARLSSSQVHPTLCEPCQFRIVSQQLRAARCHPRLFATNPKCFQEQRRHNEPQKPAATGRSVGKPARGFEGFYQDGSPLSSANTSSKDNILKSSENDQEASTGKPAPGFEDLYAKDSAMSGEGEEGALPAGRTRLSKDEEEMLGELLDTCRKGLPPSEFQKVEEAFQAFRKIGIPTEFREIMDKLKGGAPLNIATAARLIRLTNKLRKDVAETQSQDKSQSETGSKGGKNTSSGNQSKKKSKKTPDPGRFNLQFSSNIDTGTFLAAIFTGYMLYRLLMPGDSSKEITFQEFKTTFLDKGLVNKLTVINAQRVRVDLHREATGRMYPESPARHNNFSYYFSIGSVEAFDQNLRDAQDDLGIPSSERIPVQYKAETLWSQALLSFGPTILFVAAIYWLTRRSSGGGSSGGIFGMGRSKAKKFNHDSEVKVRFKDVAGMDEAKQEIMEFVSFLKEPGQYQRLGAKIPRGALLSGPPGTGKTMLAKATAGESGVPFFSISGSEFVEIFVGVGASRVRDLFQTARKSAPCIIFIDEIDAVGKTRSKSTGFGGNDEREGTLNQILTEMDGFNTSEQVVVLAGTNRADVLDKALLRPGRFDRQISIDRPTMEGRKQIFNVHIKNIITDKGTEFPTGRLAALTPGFSGADIANCVNEAALIAARTQAETVSMTHFEQAIERVIGGLEKKSLVLNPVEKRTVAYHEAGHAICGWFFKYADPLLKVSIIPRGQGALGYAQYLPPGETYLMTVNQLMDRMAMALGGRVSEEIHFETVTSGASDDFNKVTRMATAMVTKWGMSNKMGYVYFDDSNQESQFQKPFSEHTAMEIDGEVRRIVDEALTQCRDLLREKKKELGLVAEELLSKEVLGRDDLVRILGKRPFEDNAEFTKYFDAPPPPPPAPESIPPNPPEGGAVAARRVD